MAKTPQAVLSFLGQLAVPTRAKAAREAADLQAQIKSDGQSFELEPWDWNLYSEQVRKMRYDLDEAQLKPVLPNFTRCWRTACSTPPTSSTA